MFDSIKSGWPRHVDVLRSHGDKAHGSMYLSVVFVQLAAAMVNGNEEALK